MRAIYYTASSLDGFLADPDHSLAWLFAQQHVEPEDPNLRMDTLPGRTAALVMGSSTYQFIRDEASDAVSDAGSDVPWPYPQPTWVFSHREQEPINGADLRFASGDVVEVVEEIEAVVEANASDEGADPDAVLWVVGGGDLAGQFIDAGLLDEVIISYAPVTLGEGAPLLSRRCQLSLVNMETAGDFISARFTVEGPRPAADWAV